MNNTKKYQAGKFELTSFLIGFAIALWLAMVVLFLLPQQYQEPCCPTVQMQTSIALDEPDRLWLPSGDERYYCTNNDHGGGVVEDHGGGVVDDHGGGVVDDSSTRVPSPMPEAFGRSREHHEFWCDLNSEGGPVVRGSAGQVIVVAMPVEAAEVLRCGMENGQPLVVNSDGYRISVDHGGGVVDDHGRGVVDDSWSGEKLPETAQAGETYHCMLIEPDQAAIIVDSAGQMVN
jgi:hypothetical protein